MVALMVALYTAAGCLLQLSLGLLHESRQTGGRAMKLQWCIMPWLHVKFNHFEIISEAYCSSWIF